MNSRTTRSLQTRSRPARAARPAADIRRRENAESRILVENAFRTASALGITKLLVQADELHDIRLIEKLRESQRIIWVSRGDGSERVATDRRDVLVSIPDVTLTRMSQINMALLLAVLNDYVELDESIICLSGVAGSRRLDTLLITNPRRDYAWFREKDIHRTRDVIATREMGRVLDIALRFAAEGREGRPIGTTFVICSRDELEPHLRQLILNPCEGHPRRARSIHNSTFVESLRELAALDGAMIVSSRGVVESAGTYIDAPLSRARISPGLGARHAAAAAITSVTDALAVTISESSGTVTLFHQGQAVLEFDKAQAGPAAASSHRPRGADDAAAG